MEKKSVCRVCGLIGGAWAVERQLTDAGWRGGRASQTGEQRVSLAAFNNGAGGVAAAAGAHKGLPFDKGCRGGDKECEGGWTDRDRRKIWVEISGRGRGWTVEWSGAGRPSGRATSSK